MTTTRPHPGRTPITAARLLGWTIAGMFPLALWLAATLALGGDLGMSTDDYTLILRDPSTNAAPSPFNPWINHPYFWRPLHIGMLHTVGTVLHSHWSLVHIACAAMHGLVACAIFLFLRSRLNDPRAPAAAALLFLVAPMNHEVIFWFSTLSAGISSLLILALLRLYSGWAAGTRGRFALAIMPALAFLAPCFYEQPAAGLLALPALYFAVRPRDERFGRSLLRCLSSTSLIALGCMLYVGLMLVTTPEAARGGAASFVHVEQLSSRFGQIISSIQNVLTGGKARELLRGGLAVGWSQLTSGTLWVWIPAVAITIPPFFVWWLRPSLHHIGPSSAPNRLPPRRAWLVVTGLLMFLGAWLPVFAIHGQGVDFRTLYFPLIGLAIVLAALLDALLAAVRARIAQATLIALAAAVLVPAVLLSTVVLIGAQTMWQRRARIDQSELAQLRQLIPDPPRDAFFVPIELAAQPASLNLPWFDRFRLGVFQTDWSSRAAIRRAFQRADVRAIARQSWRPYGLTPTPAGLLLARGVKAELEPQTDGPDGALIPHDRLIPFVEGPKGQIKLVRELVFQSPDGTSTSLSIPSVQSLVEKGLVRRGLTASATIPLPAPAPPTSLP